jgi:glutamate--cysteine ligase
LDPLLQSRYDTLKGSGATLLQGICRGLEKEGLRVDASTGMLAQTPHPTALGSALTHPGITTDYSESLLEFITPVASDVNTTLTQLDELHRFTASTLSDELVWGASMPCILAGDASIPIAHYGTSNVGQMKRVYRNGLGVRYGRMMQAIAGIHYNFSMPEEFWQQAWEKAGRPASLKDFQTQGYLDLIRNFFERAWLLVYLLGASPAVCASFLSGNKNHQLLPADPAGASLYLPEATSLRMGDLGYTSNAQAGLQVCYNDIQNYIATLRDAIVTPHGPYAGFKTTPEGELAQLNDSLLQIENEFYSPIRPKRVTQSGEAPVVALQRGGIEYIEVRCIDINPFLPLGIDADTLHLLDTFLVNALLTDSPWCDEAGQQRNKENLRRVVNAGRNPDLLLQTPEGESPMRSVADRLLDSMAETAALLDQGTNDSNHCRVIDTAREKLSNPDLTPSGRIVREMKEQDTPFWRLALNYSQQWQADFLARPLSDIARAELETAASVSRHQQLELEAKSQPAFADYLERFYRQYNDLA